MREARTGPAMETLIIVEDRALPASPAQLLLLNKLASKHAAWFFAHEELRLPRFRHPRPRLAAVLAPRPRPLPRSRFSHSPEEASRRRSSALERWEALQPGSPQPHFCDEPAAAAATASLPPLPELILSDSELNRSFSAPRRPPLAPLRTNATTSPRCVPAASARSPLSPPTSRAAVPKSAVTAHTLDTPTAPRLAGPTAAPRRPASAVLGLAQAPPAKRARLIQSPRVHGVALRLKAAAGVAAPRSPFVDAPVGAVAFTAPPRAPGRRVVLPQHQHRATTATAPQPRPTQPAPTHAHAHAPAHVHAKHAHAPTVQTNARAHAVAHAPKRARTDATVPARRHAMSLDPTLLMARRDTHGAALAVGPPTITTGAPPPRCGFNASGVGAPPPVPRVWPTAHAMLTAVSCHGLAPQDASQADMRTHSGHAHGQARVQSVDSGLLCFVESAAC